MTGQEWIEFMEKFTAEIIGDIPEDLKNKTVENPEKLLGMSIEEYSNEVFKRTNQMSKDELWDAYFKHTRKIKELRNNITELQNTIERLEGFYGNLQQEHYVLQEELEHYKDMYESLKGILNQKGF